MKKNEIWWVELPKPIGRMPVLLLSRDVAYKVRNAVTVAEITTKIRNIPVEVLLDKRDGMPKKCAINLDTIITIRKSALISKITVISSTQIKAVDEAICFALDIKV